MHRSLPVLVAIGLVASGLGLTANTGAQAPSDAPDVLTEGETRVDHGDNGFTIYDNGTFIGPAGDTASVDAAVGSPASDEEVNTGNHKSYDFVANPPEKQRSVV